jgi:hypothetical protein
MNDKVPPIFDTISESLGVEFNPSKKEITLPKEKLEEHEERKVESDFEYARKNLKELIDKGMISLENAISLAESLDQPHGFEVVSTFAKQLAEMNKDLMDLHKQKKEIQKENITVNNNTTNAIYVGSTSDLQDLINKDRSRKKALGNGEEQR